jgi:hypothetical protein
MLKIAFLNSTEDNNCEDEDQHEKKSWNRRESRRVKTTSIPIKESE